MLFSRFGVGARLPFVCSSCIRKLQSGKTGPPNSFNSGGLWPSHQYRSLHLASKSSWNSSAGLRREQRRCISRNHIRKIARADDDWSTRAEDIKQGRKRSVLDMLEERGFVHQITGTRNQLKHLLDNRRVGIYAGIDPTAASMHVGHMIPFMALSWMYVYGYPVYFLLGGSTARIGDPEGRLNTRSMVKSARYKADMTNMHMQLKRFGASMEKYADRRGYQKEWAWRRSLVNNSQWQSKTSMQTFLNIMGHGVRLGPMLGRDSVRNRQEKGDGMSFAEFTYPLMQAWDWWELFQNGVQVQIGGADQFGNILQGAEAVKYAAEHQHQHRLRVEQEEKVRAKKNGAVTTDDPMGWTVPLLTTASGEKFGKSAGNAVWLDKDMTSCFDLYQFFLRSADADVEKYLKLFTFLPIDEISKIMKDHEQDQSKRIAQHKLAREFVELIHGLGEAEIAERQHRQIFGINATVSEIQKGLNQRALETVEEDRETPADLHPRLNKHAKPQDMHSNSSTQVTLPRSLVIKQPLSRILYSAGLTASRSEGQRLINAGGVYIGAQSSGNAEIEDSVSYVPAKDTTADFVSKYVVDDNLLILRTGKWRVKIIQIVPDKEFRAAGLTCPGWEAEENSWEALKKLSNPEGFTPMNKRMSGRY